MATTKLDQASDRLRDASIGAISQLELLAILFGVLLVAAIAVVKSGALTTVPSEAVIGVLIPTFFVTAFAAVGRDGSRGGTTARARGPHAADVADVVEDDAPRQSEDGQVERWRHMRLAALGVADETAIILAARREFSVHEFERLLAAGCPLGTALRILHPV